MNKKIHASLLFIAIVLQRRYEILSSIEQQGFRRVSVDDNVHKFCQVDFSGPKNDSSNFSQEAEFWHTSQEELEKKKSKGDLISVCQEILFVRIKPFN